MKECKMCFIEKSLNEYYKTSKNKDHLDHYCKVCRASLNRMSHLRCYNLRKYGIKITKKVEVEEQIDVSHIGFKALKPATDIPNTQILLQKIGYDITQDIHEQFNQRVLNRFGVVLPYKERPQDNISKHFE
jgi:hypothetical protein